MMRSTSTCPQCGKAGPFSPVGRDLQRCVCGWLCRILPCGKLETAFNPYAGPARKARRCVPQPTDPAALDRLLREATPGIV